MKLDKKQLPQFIALGVLTVGVSGYTVFHFVSAGPVSAGTRPAAAPVSTRIAGAPGLAAKPGAPKLPAAAPAGTADTGDAPPPSPAMHDPFAVGYVDPGTLPAAALAAAAPKPLPGKQVAALPALTPLPIGLPAAPPLPGGSFSGVPMKSPGLPMAPFAPALPAAPALPDPPKWTVTGVLMGEGGEVAILRNGETRRIVRAGDFVDSVYKVTGVSRTAVQLRHGALVYRIVLGGVKPTPGAAPLSVPMAAPPSVPASAPPKLQMPAMLGSAIIPVSPLALTAAPSLPIARKPSPSKVARAISLGLRLLDGTVLVPRKD